MLGGGGGLGGVCCSCLGRAIHCCRWLPEHMHNPTHGLMRPVCTPTPGRLVEAGRNFESRAAQVLMLARDGVSFANVIQVGSCCSGCS